MSARCIKVFCLLITLAIFWGCGTRQYYAGGETNLDANWGKSFESMKRNQILNPEAGKNLEPVVGMDGRTAMTLQEKHQKAEPVKIESQPLGILPLK
jgi:hypothetical protein